MDTEQNCVSILLTVSGCKLKMSESLDKFVYAEFINSSNDVL